MIKYCDMDGVTVMWFLPVNEVTEFVSVTPVPPFGEEF
jgi:hypothetical protein